MPDTDEPTEDTVTDDVTDPVADDVTDTGDDPETFPREYVVQLRQEAAEHRTRAARAGDLGQRLHTALVAASGRLADPSDLPYDEAHLDDTEALETAVDDLLARKPHLASRRPSGDVGQGATGTSGDVDLAGMLRGLAG